MKRTLITTTTFLLAVAVSSGLATAQNALSSADTLGSLGSSGLPGSSTTNPVGIKYVALGDSYAAYGSLNSPKSGPAPCLRGADNYPAEVIKALRANGTDSSCGGAKTEHVLSQWDRGSGVIVPAQVESLKRDTELVTLSIGGNDIDFGTMTSCLYEVAQDPNATPCEDRLKTSTDQKLTSLTPRLNAVHEEINRRSPNARVIVTGYYSLVASSGSCPAAGAMSMQDRNWVADLTRRVNQVRAEAAMRAGAEFVLPAHSDEHTACAEPAQRWVDGTGRETNSHAMHPTALGQKVMANAVTTQYGQHG